MSQGVAGGMGGGSGNRGPDFDLSDEILRVIPTDAYEQLDLARKLTSMAIASRVSNLESETAVLRRNMSDKDRLIRELEERASHLEKNFMEAESRLKPVMDENVKLAQERDSLSATVKKLSRDLSKLETFKRQLMKSLSEDNSPTQTVDIGTYDQSVSRAYPDTAKPAGQRFSIMPYHITPHLTPTGTPKIVSAVGSPRKTSGSTTPKSQYEKKVSFSPWIPSSQQSSAANSPPRARPLSGRPPKLDGKEFFRQARSRLSYEQFSAFLANIKDLNAQKQSREETLKKAEDIFGAENKDLYLSFQGLISRNVH